MSQPFIGEIRMFAGNFAPRGWALCNGQLLPIASNQALFAIIGTYYGGNGTSTFQLPNMQGRTPVHAGQGPGLGPVILGEQGGVESVQLTLNNLPAHTHAATFTGTGGGGGGNYQPPTVGVTIDVANTSTSNVSDPTGNIIAVPKPSGPGTINAFQPASAKTGTLGGVSVTVTGGSGGGITGGTVTVANTGAGYPVETQSPYLAVNFIIATMGIFPSRN